jgi:hypothetical protein
MSFTPGRFRGALLTLKSILLILPMAGKNEKELKLSMPVDEAGCLFRELYYRNIISLEDARQIGAFL